MPGGILCRVAASHVRIGTFEFFARSGKDDDVRTLADFVIQRHYPSCSDQERPYAALLEQISRRTAQLVSAWMSVGFVHGVMNTDNLAISGETLDYGPFGFLDTFAPDTAFSYIDRRGRYAWSRQPMIANWNLARLAECLLPLLDNDPNTALEIGNSVLTAFQANFESEFHSRLVAKIGLTESSPTNIELATDLLDRMAENQVDMTLLFRALSHLSARPLGTGCDSSQAVQPARQFRSLGQKLAHRPRRRWPGRFTAPTRHAGGQSRLHPAQPPGPARSRCRRQRPGLRTLARDAEGVFPTV